MTWVCKGRAAPRMFLTRAVAGAAIGTSNSGVVASGLLEARAFAVDRPLTPLCSCSHHAVRRKGVKI